MRERKWILYLTLTVAVTILGFYFGWSAFKANDRIRKLILSKIQPFTSESIDIASLEVGIGKIRLHGVNVTAKDSAWILGIEHAEINYSFLDLVKNKITPYKASREAVFVRPSLTIRRFGQIKSDSLRKGSVNNFSSMFAGLRRVTVAGAMIYIEGSAGDRITLAHDLNGWLQKTTTDSAAIRLSGKVFNSNRRNIKFTGMIDIAGGQVERLTAELEDSKLAFDLPLLLPDFIEAVDGKIKGNFAYHRDRGFAGGLTITGGVLATKRSNLLFEDVLIEGDFIDDNLDVEVKVASFNGIPFQISGKVENIFNPEADLKLAFPTFDLQGFLQRTMPTKRIPLHGNMTSAFDIRGSLGKPVIKGTLISQDLQFSGISFDGFMAELEYSSGTLKVMGEGKHANGMSIQLSGNGSLKDSILINAANIRLSGDAMPLVGGKLKMIKNLPAILELRVSGGVNNFKSTGLGQVIVDFANGSRLPLSSDIIYENEILNLKISSHGKELIAGKINGLLSAEPEWNFDLLDVEDLLIAFIGRDRATKWENIDVSGNFAGSPSSWILKGDGKIYSAYGERIVGDLVLEGNSRKNGSFNYDLSGDYYSENGNVLDFMLKAELADSLLAVRSARIGKIMEFQGKYPLNNKQIRFGELKFTDFRLEDLHEFFPSLSFAKGRVTGGAVWSQKKDKRITDVAVNLQQAYFHNSRQYKADVMYQKINGKIVEAGLNVFQDDKQVLAGRLDSNINDVLKGNISGHDMDFGDIVQAISGDTLLKGTGALSIDIIRKESKTISAIDISIPVGKFGPIPYSDFVVRAADTTSPGQTWPQGSLSILKSKLQVTDSLKILAWGDLNHGGRKKSDISILAEGDILGMLPLLTPVVKEASGNGELFLRLAGSSTGLVPGSGRLSIAGGKAKLAEIIDKVEDVNVDIVLSVFSRMLDIKNISGKVEKGTFTISNRFIDTETSKFAPLVFPRLSIGLGVLDMTTTGKGLHMHIPGLMEQDDKGWIMFSGLEKDTPFLICGPVANPRLRGTLLLEEARVTYPFLVEESNVDSTAELGFIDFVDFDLNVLPRKDVYFIRQINNPLGNLFIDLKLSDDTGNLRVAGIGAEGGVEVWGTLVSTAGTIEVIDHLFRPERIVFDHPKGALDPLLYGRAFTTVIDSMGRPSTVWLEITSINDDTGIEQAGGPWSKVTFKLSTDNPNLARTEADLMSALGYSESQLKDRAYSALGLQVENMIVRPLLRPLEKGLRRSLGLDVVRFSSMFSRNLVQMQNYSTGSWTPIHLLRSSRLTLGKYLANGLYMTYTGRIHSNNPYLFHTAGIGFRHALILEYSISPDLFLEMEYTYDTQLLARRREDKRIWLRHVFNF